MRTVFQNTSVYLLLLLPMRSSLYHALTSDGMINLTLIPLIILQKLTVLDSRSEALLIDAVRKGQG
jgi:hypothetical protein